MNYAIILAGGIGSRFWPFSRELEPKQFMQVIGNVSLLQATIMRLKGVIEPKNIYIITNQIYLYELEKQIKQFNIPNDNIILEPEGKNTAPAVGLCARLISKKDKNAVLAVFPADHYISNNNKFQVNIKEGILCAQDDYLVTIGIKPKGPSTGYGYIKVRNRKKATSPRYYIVERFLEKPDFKRARQYFSDKSFFWNSGIFIWKAKVYLDELKAYLPALYAQINAIKGKNDIVRIWPQIRPVSVDYGIMEYSKRIALIKAEFDWTDLGSWDALNEIMPADKHGNVISADSLDFASRGISVFSRSQRLISTIGVRDLIIADTPDALLVCHKDKAQDVKKIVESLKSSKRKEHIVHVTEKRPWGAYTVLEKASGFKIKLIEIEPQKRLSLQRHKNRAEHWVVVSGTARVTSNGNVRLVKSNESIYIPKGTKHRLENPTRQLLKIVEVQTGIYLEEDDIERFDDDYKRR